jgi:sterol 3beta-glucosyltransferase
MRIAVVCNDTRGGVQPYVALALGLRSEGHDVRAVAPSDLASMFRDVGLPVAPLSGSIEAVLRTSDGAAERGAIASMRLAARELPRIIHAWTKETLDACAGVEVVTGGIGGMVIGLSVAEKVGARFVESHLQPIGAPTDAYPGVLLPGVPRWLGGWGRRLSHRLSESALWMSFRGPMATARKKVLGLDGEPNASRGQPVLYGFSRHVVPVPTDSGRPRIATGYWVLPTPGDWVPPQKLEAFLARKGTVVTIGFGSMASRDAEALTRLVLGAVRGAGVRAVLVSGWGGLKATDAGDDVFFADSLPHGWLFPRVAAVVHHGGAGTTGTALRAGVPAIVVPFTMDQPFWGSRVESLGAGPKPIPRSRLTEGRLVDALRVATGDTEMRTRAAVLGAKLREEDGVAQAVAHFSRLATQ